MGKYSLFTTLLLSSLSAFGWTYPEEGTQELPYETGLGTQESPYIITTAQQLANLAWSVNTGVNYKGIYFKLGNDIDLGPDHQEWVPIGLSTEFRGNFDGDGHTISNLYIHEPAMLSEPYHCNIYAGLFGRIAGSKISNLNLTDVSINFSVEPGDDNKTYYVYVGSVVAASNSADNIICDITSQGDIEVGAATSRPKIGGIVGEGLGLNAIYGGSFNGSISVSGSEPFTIDHVIGGIAGKIDTNEIHDLTNEANIFIKGESFMVGGIAGDLVNWGSEPVANLINRGDIEAGLSQASGIATKTFFTGLENAHNYGTLTHDEEGGACWGITQDAIFNFMKNCSNNSPVQGPGLIGYGDFLALVEDCSNNADVEGAAIMTESGPVDKIIFRRCTNTGAASCGILEFSQFDVEMDDCHNSGEITGRSGLFGDARNFQTKVTLKNCSNKGNVNGSDVSYVGYYFQVPVYCSYVGGLVAQAKEVDMENCFNEGKVIGCLVEGGLVGSASNLNMSECYNLGEVEFVSNGFLNDKLLSSSVLSGGLVGYSNLGRISKSQNYGNITLGYDEYSDIEARLAGGIAGELSYPLITSVENHGNLSTFGKASAAGLIGKIYGEHSDAELSVSCSYNDGAITSENATAAGLCAFTSCVTIDDCYSTGDISGETAVGITGEMSSVVLNSCFSYSKLKGTKVAGIGNAKWDGNVANRVYWLVEDYEPIADYSNTPIQGNFKGYTAKEFESGIVCIALNNGRFDDAPWGQIPEVDPYPLLNGAGDPDINSVESIPVDNSIFHVTDLQGRIYGDFESCILNQLPAGIYILTDKKGNSIKVRI